MFAVQTAGVDAAFFIGELAVANISLRALKFAAKIIKVAGKKAVRTSVTDGAGKNLIDKKDISTDALEAKYGKPEEVHNGGFRQDKNKKLPNESAEDVYKKQQNDKENGENKKRKSTRDEYLGDTPGKNSRTGREVRDRMRKKGTLKTDPKTGKDIFTNDGINWYDVDTPNTHMGHYPKDAVDWWNDTGYKYGAKSKEVREWMLDSKNYRFEYGPENSSRGGASKARYRSPESSQN